MDSLAFARSVIARVVAGDAEAVGHVGGDCPRATAPSAVQDSVEDTFFEGLMRRLRVVVVGGRMGCGCSSRGFRICFRIVFYVWEHMGPLVKLVFWRCAVTHMANPAQSVHIVT